MNPWVYVAGWTLIHSVWLGGLIAFASAALLRLCRHRSANMRYVLACTALVAMLVSLVVTAHLLSSPTPISQPFDDRALSAPATMQAGSQDDGQSIVGGHTRTEARPILGRVDALLPVIVSCWLAGVVLLLVLMGNGWWCVHRLRVSSLTDTVSAWEAAGARTASRLGLVAAIRVVDSPFVDTPMVIGWLKPAVLLPVAALSNLTPAQVEAILAHEMAHIRRHDYVVNLLQNLAETLLFYHPGMWWISARIRVEREHCCDDVAVWVCGDPVGYAAALAELEIWRTGETVLALAATSGSLLERVRRLLRVPIADEARVPSWAATAVLTLLLAAGTGGVQHVRLMVATSHTPRGSAVEARSTEPSGSPKAPIPRESSAVVARSAPEAQIETPQRVLSWRVYTTDYFEVFYYAELDQQLERIAGYAERAYQQIRADLRHDLAGKVPLILFRTRGELEQLASAATLPLEQGPRSNDFRSRMLLPIDGPSDRLYGLVVHELTHHFTFDILPPSGGRPAPSWLVEGLADYERGTWTPRDLLQVRDTAAAGLVPRITTLDGDEDNTSRRAQNVGHAAFEFIEATYGKDGIRQFLLAVRNNRLGRGENVYEAAFQVTASEFDLAFDAYLKDRFASADRPGARGRVPAQPST